MALCQAHTRAMFNTNIAKTHIEVKANRESLFLCIRFPPCSYGAYRAPQWHLPVYQKQAPLSTAKMNSFDLQILAGKRPICRLAETKTPGV